LTLLPAAACAQPWLTQEGDRWVRIYHDIAAAKPRLRINAHGPVTLEGGVSTGFEYTVKLSVRARSREQARALLEKAGTVRAESQNEWYVLTTPGGEVTATVTVRGPHLREAIVTSSDGAVEAYGIDGALTVDTGSDQVKADRIHGDCSLATGGGDIHVGSVDGVLRCTTGAGSITAKAAHEVVLRTSGGDISALTVSGSARVETGGGTVHLGYIEGPVTAINGGGPIIVDQATGIVTTRDMAGAVTVHQAAGIRCDSANGGIQLGRISGPMRVSTAVGNIVANLVGSRLAESYLATGNGDITVLIPSNVGVRISAENQMADSLRRILSDFREIQPHLNGMHLVADGRLNGGGPLLQLSASSGTIFLKRQ
jgi:DUF4097 and DUF4098 domain-containing protein YvlB